MRNILYNYPQPKEPRYLEENFRSFNDRIIASYKDSRFYHGSKSTGYGGYKYDGRWKQVAANCKELYNLNDNSSILHINCDFGFLLSDLKNINKNYRISGTESSHYAMENLMINIKDDVIYTRPQDINFKENIFDLTIVLGVVYTLTIPDAIKLLKKITFITKNNNSFITLATYEDDEELKLFNSWTLGGNLCLKREEWKMIFKETNYKGDYLFVDSNYLNLKFK